MTHAREGSAPSPDGASLASASFDSTLRTWRSQDGALLRTLAGGSDHVYAVAFSRDGQLFASGARAAR